MTTNVTTSPVEPRHEVDTVPDATAAMFNFLRQSVLDLRLACGETLPAILTALRNVLEGTESATQHTVQQAEALGHHIGRMAEALTRLESHLSTDPEARSLWSEAVQACLGMSAAITAIATAMAFREPAGERLRATIDSTDTLRARFVDVLALLNLPGAPAQNGASRAAPSPFNRPPAS